MITKLNPEDIYRKCDPEFFKFNTTQDIVAFEGTIGQEKALKALDFGLGINSDGFNIFALGESGTGKMTTITTLLNEKAAQEETPEDWCYVYNFKDPDTSVAISMEPGQGAAFQREMNDSCECPEDRNPQGLRIERIRNAKKQDNRRFSAKAE